MKKLLPSFLIVMSGLLAVAIWAESRSAAIYARADFTSARNISRERANGTKGAESPARDRSIDQRVESVIASFDKTTDFAIGSLLLSFAAIVLMWIPKKPIPPNPAAEPTPARPGGTA